MRQNWKLIVITAVLASLFGGVAGGVVAMSWPGGAGNATSRGRIVRVGAKLPGIENAPYCTDFDHFCIVEPQPGKFLALYAYETNDYWRQRGCAVHWDGSFTREDPATQQMKTGWFMADCTGSTFDISGRRVSGPAPRDLDQFPLKQNDGEFLVDTRTLACATPPPKASESCDRAPLPQ